MAGARRRLPLAAKLALTGFAMVLVPVYLQRYGPSNFLYFCDAALLLSVVAAWTESALLASIGAVAITGVQTLWTIDFACGFLGWHPIGMTSYMFDATLPLHVRALSLFHLWLPWVLLWMVSRLGYDRRALPVCIAAGTALLLVSWLFLPPPPAPASDPHLPVNVNLVYGPGDQAPQTIMPGPLWLLMLLIGMPLAFYLPTHLLLRRCCRAARPAAAETHGLDSGKVRDPRRVNPAFEPEVRP